VEMSSWAGTGRCIPDGRTNFWEQIRLRSGLYESSTQELLLRPFLPYAFSVCLVFVAALGQISSHAAGLRKQNSSLAADSSNKARVTRLPVTHVSLYKNGVGFFEHAGSVTGDGAVTIDLTSAQLNDVLQSHCGQQRYSSCHLCGGS
jgi:hypothetical protein